MLDEATAFGEGKRDTSPWLTTCPSELCLKPETCLSQAESRRIKTDSIPGQQCAKANDGLNVSVKEVGFTTNNGQSPAKMIQSFDEQNLQASDPQRRLDSIMFSRTKIDAVLIHERLQVEIMFKKQVSHASTSASVACSG
jgi:hypothetical protein